MVRVEDETWTAEYTRVYFDDGNITFIPDGGKEPCAPDSFNHACARARLAAASPKMARALKAVRMGLQRQDGERVIVTLSTSDYEALVEALRLAGIWSREAQEDGATGAAAPCAPAPLR
jgi:hypothetical protein